MNRAPNALQRPAEIPAEAELVVLDQRGVSLRGEARTEGQAIAQLAWSLEGTLQHLKPVDESGLPHGVELEYGNRGDIVWCAKWVHGVMHGPVVQLDENERPLIFTSFVNGSGTDIWISCGIVTEVREMRGGLLHGLMRWGDQTHPSEEGHYVRGEKHGIFRQWSDGLLAEGCPEFYLNDLRVTLHQYQAACLLDPTLNRYRAEDDSDSRAMPKAAVEAVLRAQELAEGFRLDAFLAALRSEN